MSDNNYVYVLFDDDQVNVFGIYTSFDHMASAYNNLNQSERNKLREYRIINLDINKNEKDIQGGVSDDSFLLEAGQLNKESSFPYESDI